MDVGRQNRFIEELTNTEEPFDLLLIDTAAGLSKEIVNYAIHSDEVLIVSNAEPTSVMDAYAAMKMIWASNSETPLSFFMNSVRNPQKAEEAAEKLQMAVNHFLKITAHNRGSVPFDESVSESIVQQQPVVVFAPYSAAALSFQSIAKKFNLTSAPQRSAARTASR
jgi:flagellar biosynthesis protein FlhG